MATEGRGGQAKYQVASEHRMPSGNQVWGPPYYIVAAAFATTESDQSSLLQGHLYYTHGTATGRDFSRFREGEECAFRRRQAAVAFLQADMLLTQVELHASWGATVQSW
jgi:hypothetical protein